MDRVTQRPKKKKKEYKIINTRKSREGNMNTPDQNEGK